MKLLSATLEALICRLESLQEPGFTNYDLTSRFNVGINIFAADFAISNHTHATDMYNYVIQGSFTVTMDELTHVVNAGEWIFIPAHRQHAVEPGPGAVVLELWGRF